MCANTTYNSVGQATGLEYDKDRATALKPARSVVQRQHRPVDPRRNATADQHTGERELCLRQRWAFARNPGNAGRQRLRGTRSTPMKKNQTAQARPHANPAPKANAPPKAVPSNITPTTKRTVSPTKASNTKRSATRRRCQRRRRRTRNHKHLLRRQSGREREQNRRDIQICLRPVRADDGNDLRRHGNKPKHVISHYAGSGNALTWTSEGTEKWTRNIPGIDGALDAVQTGGGYTLLQLHDLQGNIVGTAGDNESETKMLNPYNSTEFGVPQPGTTPPKYAWLGASGVSTETAFGSGVATQGGASYVPQVARALQTAPVVPPGAFPNGSSGTQFTAAPATVGAIAGAQEIATQFWQKAEAERQKAREEEAAAALQQCQAEGGCGAEIGVDPKCTLHVAIGSTISSTGKEWIYARGWGSCSGEILPPGSELEVCLLESNPWSPVYHQLCDPVIAGFEPYTKPAAQLNGKAHVRCDSEATYVAWAWFWILGAPKAEMVESKAYRCGESQEELFESLAEAFNAIFPTV